MPLQLKMVHVFSVSLVTTPITKLRLLNAPLVMPVSTVMIQPLNAFNVRMEPFRHRALQCVLIVSEESLLLIEDHHRVLHVALGSINQMRVQLDV
jgi:hypothetical protein